MNKKLNTLSEAFDKKIDLSNITRRDHSLVGKILRKEALEAGFDDLEKYLENLDIKENVIQKPKKEDESIDFYDDEERIMRNISDGNGELHGL